MFFFYSVDWKSFSCGQKQKTVIDLFHHFLTFHRPNNSLVYQKQIAQQWLSLLVAACLLCQSTLQAVTTKWQKLKNGAFVREYVFSCYHCWKSPVDGYLLLHGMVRGICSIYMQHPRMHKALNQDFRLNNRLPMADIVGQSNPWDACSFKIEPDVALAHSSRSVERN